MKTQIINPNGRYNVSWTADITTGDTFVGKVTISSDKENKSVSYFFYDLDENHERQALPFCIIGRKMNETLSMGDLHDIIEKKFAKES